VSAQAEDRTVQGSPVQLGTVDTGAVEGPVVVGRLDEVPVGEGRAFALGDEQVAVFRHRDGRVSAVDAVCPHSRGPLADGQIDARVVICPLHLNAWDLTTGESTGDQPPVRTFPCRVTDDGDLVVG
jgi:nitrite reductase/ring-hydroxylating ferredoxin subunit